MASRIELLFQAVYDDPTSDAPREVLADALLEANDPRGEFLVLQLAEARGRELSRDEKRREKKLLAEHGEDWLGPLSGWTPKGERVFRRGFLAECRVEARNRRSGPFPETDAWATVERLLVHSTTPERLRWFHGVRSIDSLDFDVLAPLKGRWEHLSVLKASGKYEPGLFDRMGELEAFPALRTLHFVHRRRPETQGEWCPSVDAAVGFFQRLPRLETFDTAIGLERRQHVDLLFQGPNLALRRENGTQSLDIDLYWSDGYPDAALEDELFTLRRLAERTGFVDRTRLHVWGHVINRFREVPDLERVLPRERFESLGFRNLESTYALKKIL